MNLKQYYCALKKCIGDKSISDEDLMNLLLEPVVSVYNLKNKMGEMFYLDKTRVSRIINQKDDVPTKIRECTLKIGFEKKMVCGFIEFLDSVMNKQEKKNFCKEIVKTDEDYALEETNSQNINEILFKAYILALQNNNKCNDKIYELYKDSTRSISVVCGDLLDFGFGNRTRLKNIVVVPVNTSFETRISWEYEKCDAPLVSSHTIHGQWLERFQKAPCGDKKLDDRIKESISKQSIKPISSTIVCGVSKDEFPIGTIAAIDTHKATYYLLAISSFDKNNRAQSSIREIETSIDSLLDFYDTYGQGRKMYIPLLGSGRSRTQMKSSDSFVLLREKMLKRIWNIYGDITIVTRVEDINKIEKEIKNEI